MDRQRIDKWLWHARVVRSRSSAAALASRGHVRINGQRVDATSRFVRVGDVVTVALDHAVRVLRVLGFAERRGSAGEALALCEPLTPDALAPAVTALATAVRPTDGSRPTTRIPAIDPRLRSDKQER